VKDRDSTKYHRATLILADAGPVQILVSHLSHRLVIVTPSGHSHYFHLVTQKCGPYQDYFYVPCEETNDVPQAQVVMLHSLK
jgi:hypothetical protein